MRRGEAQGEHAGGAASAGGQEAAPRCGRRHRLRRLAPNSSWDESLLAAELRALRADEFDLGLIGFDGAILDRLLGEGAPYASATPGGDPDASPPEPPEAPVTRPGDLWLLGSYRLLCGDATSAADVARLPYGARPHLMVTDPPYGMNYDSEWRNEAGVSATMRTGKVAHDGRADWREAWALFPDDVAYVSGAVPDAQPAPEPQASSTPPSSSPSSLHPLNGWSASAHDAQQRAKNSL